jgi:17 kDa outer membrane surface antigen
MLAPSSPFRQPRYRGTPSRWHALARCLPAGVCLLGLATGGCSFAYKLDNALAKKDDPDQVGALHPAAPKPAAEPPAEADLAIARAAVSEVLSKGGKHASMPWENPKTGARGTVTPLASAYEQGGTTCRDFLASYVKDGSESWLQGEACRAARGKWEVRNLRPWKST